MRLDRINAWRKAADARAGEALFRDARADFENGTTASPKLRLRIAQGLAALVLLTPVAIVVLGVWLAFVDFPNAIPIILGAILVASGLYVVPWRGKVPEGGFRRAELPEFFALCDAVAARLGAQPVTLVFLPVDTNASYSELRGERMLAFGLGLWSILTPAERVAVIAHELSHQVNGDVSRTGILSRGIYALGQWYDLLSPSEIVDHDGYLIRERAAEDVIAGGFMGLCRGMVELVWRGLMRLYYMDSQRAEYLADAIATRAGGVSNAQQVLTKLGLLPLIEIEIRNMVPSYVKDGTDFYQRISNAVNDAEPATREALLDTMVNERHSVDMTHPPTFQRIAFLSDIAEPKEGPVLITGSALDAEIAPILEARGRSVLDSMEEQ